MRSELCGVQEIAVLLEVKIDTVQKWRTRGHLPAPRQIVSGVPIWDVATIKKWAAKEGYPKR